MAEKQLVTGKVEEGVIHLTVRFDQELLLMRGAGERLSKELTERFREIQEEEMKAKEGEKIKPISCVVEIDSKIAGSPLVRALFELWKEVRKEDGEIVSVNYPPDYIPSLTSLGLPALPGFSLSGTTEAAIHKLTKR